VGHDLVDYGFEESDVDVLGALDDIISPATLSFQVAVGGRLYLQMYRPAVYPAGLGQDVDA